MHFFSRFLLLVTVLVSIGALLHALPTEELADEIDNLLLESENAENSIATSPSSTTSMDTIHPIATSQISAEANTANDPRSGILENHQITTSLGASQHEQLLLQGTQQIPQAIPPEKWNQLLEIALPRILFDEKIITSCREERNLLLQEIATEEQMHDFKTAGTHPKEEAVLNAIEATIESSNNNLSSKREDLRKFLTVILLQHISIFLEENDRHINSYARRASSIASEAGYTQPIQGKKMPMLSEPFRTVEYKAIIMKQRDVMTEILQRQATLSINLSRDLRENNNENSSIEGTPLNKALSYASGAFKCVLKVSTLHQQYIKMVSSQDTQKATECLSSIQEWEKKAYYNTQAAYAFGRLARKEFGDDEQLQQLLGKKCQCAIDAISAYTESCNTSNAKKKTDLRTAAILYDNVVRLEDRFLGAMAACSSLAWFMDISHPHKKLGDIDLLDWFNNGANFPDILEITKANDEKKAFALKKAEEATAVNNEPLVERYTQAAACFNNANKLWQEGSLYENLDEKEAFHTISKAFFQYNAGLVALHAAETVALNNKEQKEEILRLDDAAIAYRDAAVALTAGKKR